MEDKSKEIGKSKRSDGEIEKKIKELLKSCNSESEFRQRCEQEFSKEVVRDIRVSGLTKFEQTRAVSLYLAGRNPIYAYVLMW